MRNDTSKHLKAIIRLLLIACLTIVFGSLNTAHAQTVSPKAEIGNSGGYGGVGAASSLSNNLAAQNTSDIEFKADETGTSFVLNAINVSGSTVFSSEELEAVYANYIGTDIDAGVVFKIAADLTAYYRQQGYILGQVIVPPQEIDGGVVRLKAIEGYVDQIVVEGELGSDRELVHAYGERIKASRPLRADDLERYLLLAGDVAGLNVEGILSPSDDNVGASTLTIKSEYDWFEGSFAAVNSGSHEVGPDLLRGDLTFNSVLGMHERVMLKGAVAAEVSELQSLELQFSAPINDEGTSFFTRYAGSNSNPGNGLQAFNVHSIGSRASIGFKHAAIRSREENLFLTGQFDWDNLRSASSLGTLSDDHLRIMRGIVDYDFVDTAFGGKPAVNVIRVTFSQGLDILGATNSGSANKSRTNGSGVFTSLQLDAQRQQILNHAGLQLLIGARAQVTNVPLLSSEEFSFGGGDYGRGYDPSTLSGDNGFAGKIELQYMPEEAFAGIEFLQDSQFYTFVDFAAVENLNADGLGNSSFQNMWSAGVGVRLGLGDDVDLDLALAYRGNPSTSVKNLGHDRLRGLVKFEAHF